MRNVIVLTLAFVALMAAGCSSSGAGKLPKGEVEASYAASVTTTAIELHPRISEPEAAPGTPLVHMEVRIIEVDRNKARELLARAPENLKSLNGKPRGYTLERAKLAQLLDSMRNREHSRIVGAPRLTCYDKQRGVISLVTDHSYVSGFDVFASKDGMTTEPVMSTIQDGMVAILRPEIARDGTGINLDVQVWVARLGQPLQQIKSAVPGEKGDFILQVPLLKCERLRLNALVNEGETLVLTGLQAEKSDRVLLVLVNASTSDTLKK